MTPCPAAWLLLLSVQVKWGLPSMLIRWGEEGKRVLPKDEPFPP